ncbi:MAG TPA: FtsX-like permease family protein [Magnetovibrio sp.]
MARLNDIALAARIAARDLRGGMQRLALLVVGVFVGVAAVALVGSASQSLIDASRQGALETVGGDLSLRLFHRLPSEAELSVIRQEGDVSVTAELRPMARAVRGGVGGGSPVLVELKGVDLSYPLYGAVRTLPHYNLYQTLNQQGGVYGAVADPSLFEALGLEPGDSVQIGDTKYQLRARLVDEPDRAFRAFTLGPRVMVLSESLPTTGLVGEGAEAYFYIRVKLPRSADATAAMARIDRAFPDAGWRMVNAQNGVPGIERSLAMAHVLLLFIGLGVMLVGGAGISGAVRAHVAVKMETIAILKSIGTPPGVVTLAIGLEVMAAAVLGALLGVAAGALGPGLARSALADQLPFTLSATIAFEPLVAAGLFGVLVAALFAWWPLMAVKDMSARLLLRERIAHAPGRLGVSGWLGASLIATALVLLVFWASPMPLLTLAFLVGGLALAGFYVALGRGLSRLAKNLAKGRSASVRLALGNLYRVGAPTVPVVMALGLTVTLLVALDGIGAAASRHVQSTLPTSAPDLVAFSIKPETANELGEALATSGLVERSRTLPFVHARVQAIKDSPVRDLKIPASLQWVVRGDRGVSFSAQAPEGTRIVEGVWWNAGQARTVAFSVDAGIAQKLGLKLGDALTLNVSGTVMRGPIMNLREVDWTGLDLDFPIIVTPGAFDGVGHTFAASLKANLGEAPALAAFVKTRFPDVPLIHVADVLAALADALAVVVAGLEAAALLCGAAAVVVLGGSVLQGLSQRTDEATLFKVLGARQRQLLGVLTVEFLGLGVLVTVAAVPLGMGIAYGVARASGLEGASVAWSSGLALAVAAIVVTLGVGLMVTVGAYRAAPARLLRNRGV